MDYVEAGAIQYQSPKLSVAINTRGFVLLTFSRMSYEVQRGSEGHLRDGRPYLSLFCLYITFTLKLTARHSIRL